MQQDVNGQPPETDDLVAWADYNGLTHPILADPDMVTGPYVVTGYPTYVVIDREMRILNADLWPFDPQYIIDQI